MQCLGGAKAPPPLAPALLLLLLVTLALLAAVTAFLPHPFPRTKPALAMVTAAGGKEVAFRVPVPSRGYELAGVLDINDEGSRDVVVVCHGLVSDKRKSVAQILSETITGHNLCRFDFAGNGESTGEWTLAGYEREMEDLRDVVQYLRAQSWTVAAIVGHSKGACCVLKYAAKYDDVPVVVPVAGRFDMSQTPRDRYTEEQWRQLAEEGQTQWQVGFRSFTVRQTDLEEKARLDMAGECARIRKSKLHIIHGTADATIPVADAHEFHKRLSGSGITIVEGGSHGFKTPSEGREQMVAAVQSILDAAAVPAAAATCWYTT